MKFNLYISDEIQNEIYSTYKNKGYNTVEVVISDILERYLNVEYFDSKLEIKNNEEYEQCPYCNEYSMSYKMFDVDGLNLEEHLVCDNCNYNMPIMS